MYPYRIVLITECSDAREALAELADRDRDLYGNAHAECLEGDENGGEGWVEISREWLSRRAEQGSHNR